MHLSGYVIGERDVEDSTIQVHAKDEVAEANSSVRQGQGKEGEEVSNFVEGLHCARALAALKIVSVVI